MFSPWTLLTAPFRIRNSDVADCFIEAWKDFYNTLKEKRTVLGTGKTAMIVLNTLTKIVVIST